MVGWFVTWSTRSGTTLGPGMQKSSLPNASEVVISRTRSGKKLGSVDRTEVVDRQTRRERGSTARYDQNAGDFEDYYTQAGEGLARRGLPVQSLPGKTAGPESCDRTSSRQESEDAAGHSERIVSAHLALYAEAGGAETSLSGKRRWRQRWRQRRQRSPSRTQR